MSSERNTNVNISVDVKALKTDINGTRCIPFLEEIVVSESPVFGKHRQKSVKVLIDNELYTFKELAASKLNTLNFTPQTLRNRHRAGFNATELFLSRQESNRLYNKKKKTIKRQEKQLKVQFNDLLNSCFNPIK